jgi:hypothetical protein
MCLNSGTVLLSVRASDSSRASCVVAEFGGALLAVDCETKLEP